MNFQAGIIPGSKYMTYEYYTKRLGLLESTVMM